MKQKRPSVKSITIPIQKKNNNELSIKLQKKNDINKILQPLLQTL